MDTSLNIKSIEQGGRKLQKTITDVNPNADGTALKTFAQGLNSLTTNTYVGTTKINIDNLLNEDSSSGGGDNPLPSPALTAFIWDEAGWNKDQLPEILPLSVTNYAASWSGKVCIPYVGIITDSVGNLNVKQLPENTGCIIKKCANFAEFIDDMCCVEPSPLPASITDIQNPTYWFIRITSPETAIGGITFVLNATEAHSSVNISLNITTFVPEG